MKKEFCIHVDVTMSGNVYITASSGEEARKIIESQNFTASDINNNFYQIGLEIVDIEEEN